MVDVRLGTDRYRALIDTGSTFSFISAELKLDPGLPLTGHEVIVGISGQREVLPKVLLPCIGSAGIEIAPCAGLVRNLKPPGLHMDFILGVNAFAAHRLQFDFREGRIYVVE